MRVKGKWLYIAIATCPSDCLLNTSDQTSWDGSEMKAGRGRSLCDSGSNQGRADEEGVYELHFESR